MEFDEVKEVQLHLFSDASRQGYAAVAYLRLKDVNNRIHCAFVMGKARLAPLREITIPSLELTAAVISVRLSKIIRDELDMTSSRYSTGPAQCQCQSASIINQRDSTNSNLMV